MRRAERLFRLVQLLRRSGRPVTASQIGDELEVSVRTVYRDIAHLQASGLPIDGEAGVGYLLRPGFDLPPITLTYDQVDALVLGVRLVAAVADPSLTLAAQELLAKVVDVLPQETAEGALSAPLFAAIANEQGDEHSFRPIRKAIRDAKKIRIQYRSLADDASQRTLRPLCLTCFGKVWLLSAWCELREDFRDFRVDRITAIDVLEERFSDEPGITLASYLARFKAK